jgi:hypothetical protein
VPRLWAAANGRLSGEIMAIRAMDLSVFCVRGVDDMAHAERLTISVTARCARAGLAFRCPFLCSIKAPVPSPRPATNPAAARRGGQIRRFFSGGTGATRSRPSSGRRAWRGPTIGRTEHGATLAAEVARALCVWCEPARVQDRELVHCIFPVTHRHRPVGGDVA